MVCLPYKEGHDIGRTEGIVLTLFWAPWCYPCRLQKTIVDALATVYRAHVGFTEINTDRMPDVANRFGVQSIPTLILFKNKLEVERLIGLHEKAQLSEMMDKLM